MVPYDRIAAQHPDFRMQVSANRPHKAETDIYPQALLDTDLPCSLRSFSHIRRMLRIRGTTFLCKDGRIRQPVQCSSAPSTTYTPFGERLGIPFFSRPCGEAAYVVVSCVLQTKGRKGHSARRDVYHSVQASRLRTLAQECAIKKAGHVRPRPPVIQVSDRETTRVRSGYEGSPDLHL